MKKHKRIPVTYQYFDYEGIQTYLERMAAGEYRHPLDIQKSRVGSCPLHRRVPAKDITV